MAKAERPQFKKVSHGKSDYLVSLSKLIGKKVVDVVGYPSNEFGDDTLVFKIDGLILEGGSVIGVEGEHDFPYLPCDEDALETKLRALLHEEDPEEHPDP